MAVSVALLWTVLYYAVGIRQQVYPSQLTRQNHIISLHVLILNAHVNDRVRWDLIPQSSVLALRWIVLCICLIWGETSPCVGKGKQECRRDSLDVCTHAKLLKCKGASRFLRTVSLIPVTATISSISPIFCLRNVQEMQDGAQGSCR